MGLLSASPPVAWSVWGHMLPQASQRRTGSETRLQVHPQGEPPMNRETSSPTSLQTCLGQGPARESESYQDLIAQSNTLKIQDLNEGKACKAILQDLQQVSLQKVEALQNDPAFQEIVTEWGKLPSKGAASSEDPRKKSNGELYIFISFSMGKKALLNLAHEAKRFGATLVLRGFKGGSYLKTAQALQTIITKTGQGVLIDPELFNLFNITVVPTVVLTKPFQLYSQERTQTPVHDKLQGHVSTQYALEQFEQQGDLKKEAHLLLKNGANS